MITQLLQELQEIQKEGISKGYLPGIFHSQRKHNWLPYTREDENLFFSSAICFILLEYNNLFNKTQQALSQKIIHNIQKNYPSFKNKTRDTYNFFKTNPLAYFPNGKVMQHFNFFKLADDADDSTYVYLTVNNLNHKSYLEILEKHANKRTNQIKHTFKKYQNLHCFNVYFGQKMPVEIDGCVLSTILLWKEKNKIGNTTEFTDSYQYIFESITSNDYIHSPQIIAPYYPTFPQIAYHYSRLSLYKSFDSTIKHKMITDILSFYKNNQVKQFDKILLEISLLKLGVKRDKIAYPKKNIIENTSFFYTSIPMMFSVLWIRKLQNNCLLKQIGLRTSCNGYLTAILLEYELLVT